MAAGSGTAAAIRSSVARPVASLAVRLAGLLVTGNEALLRGEVRPAVLAAGAFAIGAPAAFEELLSP